MFSPPLHAEQVPDLPALTSGSSNDLLYVIDVNNLTDGPNGSGRKMTIGSFTASLPLANGTIWIGGTNGIAQPFAVTGDATLATSGSLTLATVATSGTYSLGGNGSMVIDAKGRTLTITRRLISRHATALMLSPAPIPRAAADRSSRREGRRTMLRRAAAPSLIAARHLRSPAGPALSR